MAKTSGEFELEFIQTVKEKTGKTLEQWLSAVKASGLNKQMEIVKWLKSNHNLNHMQSQFVAGIFLNNGKPVYQNEDNLFENQFAKCESMKPMFNELSGKILGKFPGTRLIPKKSYLSFTADREFAAVNVKPNEIRLGLDLGDEVFNNTVQKSKLTGPMPRISHMVIITEIKQFDKKVMDLLNKSYNRSNKK